MFVIILLVITCPVSIFLCVPISIFALPATESLCVVFLCKLRIADRTYTHITYF